MPLDLVVSNPPKSIRRAARRIRAAVSSRRRRRAALKTASGPASSGVSDMAKRKRKASTRARRRRGGGGGGGGSFARGFVPADVLTTTASGVAGFIGSTVILNRLPGLQNAAGPMRIIAKAGVGLALGYFLRKTNPKIAAGLATGALISAGIDAFAWFRARSQGGGGGVQGLGLIPGEEGTRFLSGGVGNAEAFNGVGEVVEVM